ncbi:MAG: hypothetical protein Q9227_003742 [Pyrenula ochraceoflavens]
MVPIPIDPSITDTVQPKQDTLGLPAPTLARFKKANIDLSNGYPYRPARPLYLDDATAIRGKSWDHIDAGARAAKTNPSKSNLLSAATKVTHLTAHIGTEIEGLQLKNLTDQQRDELALLIAERSVVFFRDQDISPQEQKVLGEHYGKVEVHPQVPQVPGVEGVTVIWPALQATERPANFRNPGGASRWHTDLVHELQPAGITHLHNDCVPSIGGDTLWASGYAAYEKLSPAFREIIDGREAVYASAHQYLERGREEEGGRLSKLFRQGRFHGTDLVNCGANDQFFLSPLAFEILSGQVLDCLSVITIVKDRAVYANYGFSHEASSLDQYTPVDSGISYV